MEDRKTRSVGAVRYDQVAGYEVSGVRYGLYAFRDISSQLSAANVQSRPQVFINTRKLLQGFLVTCTLRHETCTL